MSRTSRRIDGTVGLHQLGTSANQLTYMQEHAEDVCELLDVLIERTYAVAPVRKADPRLKRSERKNPVDRERLLEKAIWKQFGREAVENSTEPFQEHVCRYIQTFQFPLCATRSDKYWGKVDLLGVSNDWLPVVLELKDEDASDTPLRMIVEGLAYAIAIRRVWNEGDLSASWKSCFAQPQRKEVLPSVLVQVPVIAIAPAKFWEHRIAQGERRAKQVSNTAWQALRLLWEKCSDRGFPIEFVSFKADTSDEVGLPIITDIEPVEVLQV